jgi:hypothetical protein
MGDGSTQPVRERHAGLPAEQVLGARGDEDAPALLAGLGRAVLGRRGYPDRCADLLEELDHGCLHARADIDGPARVAVLESQEVGLCDVADVHVVAGLQAVAVDDDRLSTEQLVSKDGHDAGFAQRTLARTVHVRVAQSDPADPVQACPAPEVVLDGQLRDSVR